MILCAIRSTEQVVISWQEGVGYKSIPQTFPNETSAIYSLCLALWDNTKYEQNTTDIL